MMNGSTTEVFASLKRVMARSTYNLKLKRLITRTPPFIEAAQGRR
jgi:hypothetical protein